MPKRDISSEHVPFAADLELAERCVAGDHLALDTLRATIGTTVESVSIDWCHRWSANAQCRYCSAEATNDCARRLNASSMIDNRIRERSLHSYRGQLPLAEFLRLQLESTWWFDDFAGTQQEKPQQGVTEIAARTRRDDLVQVWSILAGSNSAWESFLNAYHRFIADTAIRWCHRRMPGRICQQCKPRAYNAEQGCDSFEDAYAYILERLRHVALPAFRGVSSLNSFVYLCLHDHRWWSSLVQKETGKVKLPVVLRNSPEITQKVFYRRRWGWDSEEIARDLRLSVSSVESISDQIDEMLQGAGVRLQDRKLTFVSLSGRLSDEEGLEREYEPQAPESGIEIRAEAMQFWSSLTRQDRELLRLVVESENTTKEIAAAMGLTVTQVYNSIYRLRRQMPDWFKNPASERKTPQSSVQTIAEVSTDEMS